MSLSLGVFFGLSVMSIDGYSSYSTGGFCKMFSIKDMTHDKYSSLVVDFKKTLQHVPFVAI